MCPVILALAVLDADGEEEDVNRRAFPLAVSSKASASTSIPRQTPFFDEAVSLKYTGKRNMSICQYPAGEAAQTRDRAFNS
jgi:hypothetical protein